MANKKTALLTVLLISGVILFILISGRNESVKPVSKSLTAPDIEVIDLLKGTRLSSSMMKEKVVFINFWAAWCQPCREEMPSVQALFNEMFPQKDFLMVTILYKDSPENGMKYLKDKGFAFPVFSDPDGKASRLYGVTGVPETYIISKKGVLKKKVIGPADWNSPDEKKLIYDLLRE